jgi:polyhydroxyalkanoate synthesis regulator phasin
MNKKMAATGLAVGLLAGTGAGFVLSITGSAGAAGSSAALVAAAEEDSTGDTAGDTSGTDREAARTERITEILQPLVDDGTLTQAQLDAVVAALVEAGPVGGGPHGGRGRGFHLELVTTTLGLTVAEIREAVSNGQTLAQLAEANGSSGQALIDVLVADVKAHLDEKVADGDLTQEEADSKLAEATTRITEFVNETGSNLPLGRGPGGRHGDDAAEDSTGS